MHTPRCIMSSCKSVSIIRTSRERHKSALYLRLKNSKRTSKCQVFFYSTRKTQKLNRIGAIKGGTLSDFLTSIVAKHQKKIEREPLEEKFRKKVSQCRKKLKGGPFNLARYCMLRAKTGKTFFVQFARPNSSI